VDGAEPPRKILRSLAAHEACFILRRRAGLKQEVVARRMGVCRFWFYSMERGDVSAEELVAFWARASA
jgi:hypothetical protein